MTQQTMTDTPEAVRLADQLKERYGATVPTSQAAALLRRIPELEADYQRLMDKHNALHVNALASRQRVAELETARDVAVELAAQYAAERDQLRAELDARWQPIETAPKDGTNVLLINRALNQAAGLWMNSISGVGWYLRGGIGPDVFFNSHYGPTHWMPLPAAPTPPNADQKGQL